MGPTVKPIYKRILLLIPLLVMGLTACEDDGRRPAKIYIPDGYVGWVRIEYGVVGAPRLQTDTFGPWEYQRFPPSGLLQTSSLLQNGIASAESYYYKDDGSFKDLPRNMEHGGIISWCVTKPDGSRLAREFITYFIGPEAEYEKHKYELGQFRKGDCKYVIKSLDDLPKVGDVRQTAHQTDDRSTLGLGMSHQLALEIIRECGGKDITSNLAIVGSNGESPPSGLFWYLEQYNSVLEIAAEDGKVVQIGYWTIADFSKSKIHRFKSRQSLKSSIFDKQARTLKIQVL